MQLFVKEKESDIFNVAGKYAYFGEEQPKSFKYGETLSGQVAKNKTALNLKEIPENRVPSHKIDNPDKMP